ncbi:MAG TPA: hypothetical protein VFX62_04080 [Erythrobacter sp.]|nr:hypothetical protein [Erythrobacter sp.]
MTRFANHSFAAIAAILLTIVSLHGIVTVPPAQAQDANVPVLV